MFAIPCRRNSVFDARSPPVAMARIIPEPRNLDIDRIAALPAGADRDVRFAATDSGLRHPPRPRADGFTMVELMIAMTIGVFLLGTLTLVLANNSRTRHEIEKSIGQIQNARFALQVIAEDLSNAGFYGEAIIPSRSGTVVPDLCTSADELNNARAFPIQGADNIDTMPQSCAGIDIAFPGSDLLVVRRASTCAVGETGCDTFADGLPHLQQPGCPDDCRDPPVCSAAVATSGAELTARGRSCIEGDEAPKYRLFNRVYYLAAGSMPGDSIPTLKRAELTASGYVVAPIAEGIEHLHFEYGIDSAPRDGEPEHYTVGVLSASEWQDVVSVRVHIVARNARTTSGYEDNRTYRLGRDEVIRPSADVKAFKRQAYSATIRLNNIAGRREPFQ